MVTPQHSSLTTPFRDDKRIRFQYVLSSGEVEEWVAMRRVQFDASPLASGDSSVWGRCGAI